MNNFKKYSIHIIFFSIFLFIFSKKSFATVGGPTFISQIAYNAEKNSVFYVENNHGGRGCPPIIHSISLSKNQDEEVKNCEEVTKQFFSEENGQQKYDQFINDFYKNSFYLGSVSLKKNNIDIDVKFISEKIENGEKFWSEFQAVVFQDKREIEKIGFRGCDKNQPNVFEGYMIPNTDKMALLISNKGDCFEGGYVMEKLKVIGGIKYYDKNTIRNFKEESATEPNLGNMIIYSNPEITEKNNYSKSIMLTLAFLIIGTMFGFGIGRKFMMKKK